MSYRNSIVKGKDMEVANTVINNSSPQGSGTAVHSKTHSVQQEVAKAVQSETKVQESTEKIDSQEKLEALVDDLNKSLSPLNTSLRFGFDNRSEDFYVSVIETQTDRLIRRFPAEQAQNLLPAMQELTGMLFDVKG